jgi:hypothetical protein
VRDTLFRVSKDLGDSAPQFQRWTQKELVHALNDGQRAIAKFLPYACARVDAIKLVTGTKQSIALIPALSIKPGDGSTAVAVRGNALQFVSRNMGADGLTPGGALSIADKDILDNCSPNWHLPSKSGTKPGEYTYDPRNPQVFYVNPSVPAADTVWVEVSLLADPGEVPNVGSEDYTAASISTQVLSVDDKYLDDLVHYMMARAHMKDAESQASAELASAYSGMFVSSINAQATAMTGVNPNLQSLPMNPHVAAMSR